MPGLGVARTRAPVFANLGLPKPSRAEDAGQVRRSAIAGRMADPCGRGCGLLRARHLQLLTLPAVGTRPFRVFLRSGIERGSARKIMDTLSSHIEMDALQIW